MKITIKNLETIDRIIEMQEYLSDTKSIIERNEKIIVQNDRILAECKLLINSID